MNTPLRTYRLPAADTQNHRCSAPTRVAPFAHLHISSFANTIPHSTLHTPNSLHSSNLSIWLSVDPMSGKYPSLSPYVYCANNSVKCVDPNGEDWFLPENSTIPQWDKNVTQNNLPKGATYLGTKVNGPDPENPGYYFKGDEHGVVTRTRIAEVVIKYQDKPKRDLYNVDNAVNYLKTHAQQYSTGSCARYVVNAIIFGGGGNVNRDNAYKMGPNLEKGGFSKVNINYFEAQKGYVAVFQTFYKSQYPTLNLNKDHPYGHMQMFDGNQWISDFKQSSFWPGSDYRKAKPQYQLYRYTGSN